MVKAFIGKYDIAITDKEKSRNKCLYTVNFPFEDKKGKRITMSVLLEHIFPTNQKRENGFCQPSSKGNHFWKIFLNHSVLP